MHRYLLFSGQKLAHSQLLATFLAGLAILTVIFLYLINLSFESAQRLRLQTQTGVKIPTAEHLWETCDIFVISLPNRQDRRRDMERLRIALGLEWIYVDALSADSRFVTVIMDWVRTIRFLLEPAVNTTASSPNATIHFAWPGNLEALARSTQEIELWSSDKSPWDLSTGFIPPSAYRPIACATNDYTLAVAPLPEHMVLTPARIACWHSHLSAIHRVANNNLPDAPGVAFIFEDDVDMEADVRQQTQTLWRYLPEDWDIVFLGEEIPKWLELNGLKSDIPRSLLVGRRARPSFITIYAISNCASCVLKFSLVCFDKPQVYPRLCSLSNWCPPPPSPSSIYPICIL
jgi:hypothetical protein